MATAESSTTFQNSRLRHAPSCYRQSGHKISTHIARLMGVPIRIPRKQSIEHRCRCRTEKSLIPSDQFDRPDWPSCRHLERADRSMAVTFLTLPRLPSGPKPLLAPVLPSTLLRLPIIANMRERLPSRLLRSRLLRLFQELKLGSNGGTQPGCSRFDLAANAWNSDAVAHVSHAST
jgi:hypothetical protein